MQGSRTAGTRGMRTTHGDMWTQAEWLTVELIAWPGVGLSLCSTIQQKFVLLNVCTSRRCDDENGLWRCTGLSFQTAMTLSNCHVDMVSSGL